MSTPDLPLDALLVGSARPAADIAGRFVHTGLTVGIYDEDAEAAARLAADTGLRHLTSLSGLRGALAAPRKVWLTISSPPGERTLGELESELEPGDVLVDAGEGNFRDAALRAQALSSRGIGYADVALAAGAWGGNMGRVLAVGAGEGCAETLRPQLDILAPPPQSLWAPCGPPGSGRFVRAVERELGKGLTGVMAEGFEIYGRGGFRLQPADLARMWQRGGSFNAALGALAADFLDAVGWSQGATSQSASPGVPPAVALALSLRFAAQGAELYLQQISSLMAAAAAAREPGTDP